LSICVLRKSRKYSLRKNANKQRGQAAKPVPFSLRFIRLSRRTLRLSVSLP
jgi:hypothetical protein